MKFNILKRKPRAAKNYEGARAWNMTLEMELYTAVVSSMLQDKFYEKSNKSLVRIRELIARVSPEFVAKLAVYAREKMYLRSVPVVLVVELAASGKSNSLLKNVIARIVQRADEITEVLAYYAIRNERKNAKKLNKLSKQVQKGLAVSFNKFDEYQFAKYNRPGDITLRDALFIVHPKAENAEQQLLFDKIAKDELQTPYTWETEFSALGKLKFDSAELRQAAFGEKWTELVMSEKLGYMATLRNLRNMLETNMSAVAIDKVCSYLSNPVSVANSRQLPFRYLAAYRELGGVQSPAASRVMNALEKAIAISAGNIPGFEKNERIAIGIDFSGSMQSAVSAKSKIMNYEVGALLAMMLQSRVYDVMTYIFGENWKLINFPQTGILSNTDSLVNRIGEVGHSTNGYLVLRDLCKRRMVMERVMIFTDCQMWNSNSYSAEEFAPYWKKYKNEVAPNAKLYLFDLAGYGQTPVDLNTEDVYMIAGWSDKIFNVLAAIERGEDTLSEIKRIEISVARGAAGNAVSLSLGNPRLLCDDELKEINF